MARPGDETVCPRFSRYAWVVVGYLVLVILWGAWVRITGSGAGCGSHWPTCNGEVVPLSPTTETVIEYTHRLTSGLSLPLVLVMLVWAVRRFPRGHRVVTASVATLIFLLTEALVGAGLVTFDLVADNASVVRAVTAAFHLINTFILTACAALAAWWAGGGPSPRWREAGGVRWMLMAALVGVLVVSMTGAITALGDTLFPVHPTESGGLFERVREDLSSATHFLVRLRIVHPIVAVAVAVALFIFAALQRTDSEDARVRRHAGWLMVLLLVQTALGVVNVLLHAPGWMQIVHLLAAVAVWTSLVLLSASVLAPVAQRQPG